MLSKIQILLACVLMPYLFSNIALFEDDQLKPAFQSILEIFEISPNDSLQTAIQETQKMWLQLGKERWEFENTFKDKTEKVLPFLIELNCIETIYASKNNYDIAVIHGSPLNTFRIRLQFLIDEYKKGVRFKSLVILTGDRPLLKDLETKEQIDDRNNPYLEFKDDFSPQDISLKTEDEMIKYVYSQAKMPSSMEALQVTFVSAPHIKENGKYRRARTEDTVFAWKEKYKPKGSILAVSNQPFIGYQHTILKYFFPDQDIETIGTKASSKLPLSVHLDNLTKWLYWENKLYHLRKK